MTSFMRAPRAADEEFCPRRGPGRPRSEEAERAILDAALDLLARHGLAGLSIEAVAAHASVAKTTVYRRWSTKTELAFAAMAHLKGPVPQPPGGAVREDLLWLVHYACRQGMTGLEGKIYARLIAEAEQHPELAEQYWERLIRPRRMVMVGVLRRGVEQGLIRADADLALVAQMLVSPVVLAKMHGGPGLSDEQMEHLVDAVLAGWAPR